MTGTAPQIIVSYIYLLIRYRDLQDNSIKFPFNSSKIRFNKFNKTTIITKEVYQYNKKKIKIVFPNFKLDFDP